LPQELREGKHVNHHELTESKCTSEITNQKKLLRKAKDFMKRLTGTMNRSPASPLRTKS